MFRKSMLALLLACAAASAAVAQSDVQVEPYVPRLGDIMNGLQLRHLKLYFAGRAQNWPLAEYELRQLRAGLAEAALLYSGLPVTNVTTLADPIKSLSDAVKARDGRKFTEQMTVLTDGCNACHRTMDRNYIVLPTEQPFSNQVFTPEGKK